MISISATEAKNRFGELLESSLRGPVQISKQGRPVAILTTIEDYQNKKEEMENREAACAELIAWIQKPKIAPASEDLPKWSRTESDYATALREKYGFSS